jgi:hypothetical protein
VARGPLNVQQILGEHQQSHTHQSQGYAALFISGELEAARELQVLGPALTHAQPEALPLMIFGSADRWARGHNPKH